MTIALLRNGRGIGTAVATFALVTGGLLATSAASAGAAASSVSPTLAAAPNCTEWYDVNTFGVTCSGGASGAQVRAVAACGNGSRAYGPWRSARTGGWSYAYCAGRGGLVDGWPQVG
jgi:hypothetical protein